MSTSARAARAGALCRPMRPAAHTVHAHSGADDTPHAHTVAGFIQHRRACRLKRKLHIVLLLVLVDGAGHQRARWSDGLLFLDHRRAPAFLVLVLLVGCAMHGARTCPVRRHMLQHTRRADLLRDPAHARVPARPRTGALSHPLPAACLVEHGQSHLCTLTNRCVVNLA